MPTPMYSPYLMVSTTGAWSEWTTGGVGGGAARTRLPVEGFNEALLRQQTTPVHEAATRETANPLYQSKSTSKGEMPPYTVELQTAAAAAGGDGGRQSVALVQMSSVAGGNEFRPTSAPTPMVMLGRYLGDTAPERRAPGTRGGALHVSLRLNGEAVPEFDGVALSELVLSPGDLAAAGSPISSVKPASFSAQNPRLTITGSNFGKSRAPPPSPDGTPGVGVLESWWSSQDARCNADCGQCKGDTFEVALDDATTGARLRTWTLSECVGVEYAPQWYMGSPFELLVECGRLQMTSSDADEQELLDWVMSNMQGSASPRRLRLVPSGEPGGARRSYANAIPASYIPPVFRVDSDITRGNPVDSTRVVCETIVCKMGRVELA